MQLDLDLLAHYRLIAYGPNGLSILIFLNRKAPTILVWPVLIDKADGYAAR